MSNNYHDPFNKRVIAKQRRRALLTPKERVRRRKFLRARNGHLKPEAYSLKPKASITYEARNYILQGQASDYEMAKLDSLTKEDVY